MRLSERWQNYPHWYTKAEVMSEAEVEVKVKSKQEAEVKSKSETRAKFLMAIVVGS
jgi:hypothetical protein